jgi:hypothetical protein
MDLDQLELLPGAQGGSQGVAGKAMMYLRLAEYKATTPQFWVILLVPWGSFVLSLCLFSYESMRVPYVCGAVDVGILVLAGGYLLWSYATATDTKGLIAPTVAISCLIAIAFGTFLGVYNYDTYAIFPQFYQNTRKYTNVVSSESSGAISDAGRIIFNPLTRVDVNKSIGYISERGTYYCVAPIMDPSKQPRIQYWAAGIGCCTAKGGFRCDAARNAKAGAGVRVFDNNGWFEPSRFSYYDKARLKAEAEYYMQSVGEPMFVRWVEKDNLDFLYNYYRSRALIFVICFTILFFFLFGLYAVILWKPQ